MELDNETYISPKLKDGWLEGMKEREVLLDDEILQAAIRGSIESSRVPLMGSRDKSESIDILMKVSKMDKRDGLIGMTNKRMIFYMPKMMNRYEFEAYTFDQINTITFTKGRFKGRIEITVVNEHRIVKDIPNDEGKMFTNLVHKVIEKTKNKSTQTTVTQQQSPKDALKMRLINGEINEEEYQRMLKLIDE